MIVYRKIPQIIRDLRADPDVGAVTERRGGWVIERCVICARGNRRRVHVQSNGAPAAKPILLTRGGNQYGPILRVARAPGAPGPTEQLRVLQDLVARLRARGAEVSARKLREGYATELGVAKGRVERLVDDALAAGVLRRDGTVGGGGALLAAVEIETLKE